MSYAYQIKLERASALVTETGAWRPDVMEILPQADMEHIVREELRAQGWAESDHGVLRKEIDGVPCEIPADQLEVRALLSDEVSVSHTVIADSDDSAELRQKRIEAGERQRERNLTEAQQERRRALVAQLVELEPAIHGELDQALHRAHARLPPRVRHRHARCNAAFSLRAIHHQPAPGRRGD